MHLVARFLEHGSSSSSLDDDDPSNDESVRVGGDPKYSHLGDGSTLFRGVLGISTPSSPSRAGTSSSESPRRPGMESSPDDDVLIVVVTGLEVGVTSAGTSDGDDCFTSVVFCMSPVANLGSSVALSSPDDQVGKRNGRNDKGEENM